MVLTGEAVSSPGHLPEIRSIPRGHRIKPTDVLGASPVGPIGLLKALGPLNNPRAQILHQTAVIETVFNIAASTDMVVLEGE